MEEHLPGLALANPSPRSRGLGWLLEPPILGVVGCAWMEGVTRMNGCRWWAKERRPGQRSLPRRQNEKPQCWRKLRSQGCRTQGRSIPWLMWLESQ